MQPKNLKILIIYENGAGGHRAAARAVSEALKQFPGVEAPVLELDTLAPKYRKKMYSTFMDVRLHARSIVRFGFEWALRPNPFFSVYRGVDSLVQPWSLRGFLKVVAAEAPDLIVTAHYRANIACSAWVASGKLTVPVHSVIPDFVAHGLYAQPMLSRFYVATDAVKRDVTRHGIPADRVVVTGLPVSPTMTRSDDRSRAEIRRSLGLDPELPVMLVMGGARGDQDYTAVLNAMEEQQARAQAVILAGWNTELKAQLDATASRLKTVVHVKGFQNDMPAWYRAADVIVTKPGGMTCAEGLVMGKPIVFSFSHPGKEEVQAERLAEAGVALYERSPRPAVTAALGLLADPAAMRRMEQAARLYQPADASARIAAALVEAAGNVRRADTAAAIPDPHAVSGTAWQGLR